MQRHRFTEAVDKRTNTMCRQLKCYQDRAGSRLKIVRIANIRRRFSCYNCGMNETGKQNEPSPVPQRIGCRRHSTHFGQALIIADLWACHDRADEKSRQNPSQKVVMISLQSTAAN